MAIESEGRQDVSARRGRASVVPPPGRLERSLLELLTCDAPNESFVELSRLLDSEGAADESFASIELALRVRSILEERGRRERELAATCSPTAPGSQRRLRWSESTRVITVLPMHQVNALIISGLLPWFAGGSTVVCDRLRSDHFWDDVADEQATVCSMVPTLLEFLLATPGEPPESFREVLCGAGPMPSWRCSMARHGSSRRGTGRARHPRRDRHEGVR